MDNSNSSLFKPQTGVPCLAAFGYCLFTGYFLLCTAGGVALFEPSAVSARIPKVTETARNTPPAICRWAAYLSRNTLSTLQHNQLQHHFTVGYNKIPSHHGPITYLCALGLVFCVYLISHKCAYVFFLFVVVVFFVFFLFGNPHINLEKIILQQCVDFSYVFIKCWSVKYVSREGYHSLPSNRRTFNCRAIPKSKLLE